MISKGVKSIFPIKHKDIWDRYKLHIQAFWTPEEVSLQDDLRDLQTLNEGEKTFIKHVLAYFANSEAMINETKSRAKEEGLDLNKLNFRTSDLENLKGSFNTVICLDVFIHYPQQEAEAMVKHLCQLSDERLIVSFAPYTPLLALLKGIGQLFPGPSKTTRAYTLRETGIIEAAKQSGFRVAKNKLNQAPFYFSKLIEFVKS